MQHAVQEPKLGDENDRKEHRDENLAHQMRREETEAEEVPSLDQAAIEQHRQPQTQGKLQKDRTQRIEAGVGDRLVEGRVAE